MQLAFNPMSNIVVHSAFARPLEWVPGSYEQRHVVGVRPVPKFFGGFDMEPFECFRWEMVPSGWVEVGDVDAVRWFAKQGRVEAQAVSVEVAT